MRSRREIHILAIVRPNQYDLSKLLGEDKHPDWNDTMPKPDEDEHSSAETYIELLRPLLNEAMDEAVIVCMEYK